MTIVNQNPTPAGGGNASDLIATLLHRAPRLATAVAAARMAWPMVQRVREQSRARTTYTVKVLSTDDIYDDLHEWVLGLLPAGHQRALVAWTSRRDTSGDAPVAFSDSTGASAPPPRLRLRYDGSREQTVEIGGHRIKVVVSDGDQADKDGRRWKPDEIVFTASSLDAQRALLDAISSVAVASQQTVRKPVFRMLARWGAWERLDDLPVRDLDSVILADGQLERLIADVAAFLDSEADYLRRCVPWHRGHLYEGPPGTGKTSVARAIASHFNMDIWYLPLADVQKYCDLLNVINRITPRSMLLLEDADVDRAPGVRGPEPGVAAAGPLVRASGGAAGRCGATVMRYVDVRGRCPACGAESLHVYPGAGMVHCLAPGCPDSGAANKLLAAQAPPLELPAWFDPDVYRGCTVAVESGVTVIRAPHGVWWRSDCSGCTSQTSERFPRHEASADCRSGRRAHCTCDGCW